MDHLRIEELRELWNYENEDPETQDWRDSLTAEELAYVSSLDRNYRRGISALASAILVREAVREQFAPEEILELETVRGHDSAHCRLRLRDGRLFRAWLDTDGRLRLSHLLQGRGGPGTDSAL